MELPPGLDPIEIKLVPARHREDAVQEAWVAYLEGRNPKDGIRTYIRGEVEHERREQSMGLML